MKSVNLEGMFLEMVVKFLKKREKDEEDVVKKEIEEKEEKMVKKKKKMKVIKVKEMKEKMLVLYDRVLVLWFMNNMLRIMKKM